MKRQGDVLITPCKAQDVTGHNSVTGTNIVLAEGEATGHAHRLKSIAAITMYMIAAKRFIEVQEQATLFHEEHGKIDLDPGWYEINLQREYDLGQIRRVAD